MMNILPHETDGKFDLLIDTGRGAWIPMSKTSLDSLLQKYDNAYPTYTEGTRQELIERWHAAEMMHLKQAAKAMKENSGSDYVFGLSLENEAGYLARKSFKTRRS